MCGDSEAQEDAQPHQPLPGEPGRVGPPGAVVRDASGDLRPLAQLPIPLRRGRLLLQDLPLRDGLLRLDPQRHGSERGEVHSRGVPAQNALPVDQPARQAGHHHRVGGFHDVRHPQRLPARHLLPPGTNGGVGDMHCSEAPVDLQHGHADHHRVLLLCAHDGDQRAVPGDGPSLVSGEAAAGRKPGKELQQHHAKEDERERTQATDQQDAQ